MAHILAQFNRLPVVLLSVYVRLNSVPAGRWCVAAAPTSGC